ncbi:Clusterin_associated protein 1 [Hexamita inflata]|uniref:Clusterin_associated protein 1 n=1 Tax=Hexamita inflata TaxID=28002 RepID=A0ABP1H6K1_9EUKA
MSYAELRKFSQNLTQLGYTKPVSIDAFRTPNFQLLVDIISFLVSSLVPDAKLSTKIDEIQDRLYFINTAVTIIQSHFCIKLKPKRLYAADISAVRELSKITDEVSMYINIIPADQENTGYTDLSMVANSLRNQSSELIKRSTDLLLALKQFGDTAPANLQNALTKQPDVRQLQGAVQNRINILDEEVTKYSDELQTNKREKIHMQELLTQKQADLSRMNDRVESMRLTRPPYLIELEKAEAELTKVHQEYAKKHRSLSYLESQLRAGEAILKKKSKEKQQALSAIQDIVQQDEQENLIGGVKQELMDTPNPNKGIPISNDQIMGEMEEDEPQEEPAKKAFPQGFKENAKKEVDFSEEESVEEDNGDEEDEEPEDDEPPAKSVIQKPVAKQPPPPAKKAEEDEDEEYEEVYEDEEEEEEVQKPDPKAAPAKPAPAKPVVVENYEYEEDVKKQTVQPSKAAQALTKQIPSKPAVENNDDEYEYVEEEEEIEEETQNKQKQQIKPVQKPKQVQSETSETSYEDPEETLENDLLNGIPKQNDPVALSSHIESESFTKISEGLDEYSYEYEEDEEAEKINKNKVREEAQPGEGESSKSK